MTEKSNDLRKVKVKKKKKLGFNWFFWISFVLILIPCIYIVNLLYQSAKVTHTPIIGDRIKNTIAYKIEDSQVSALKGQIEGLEEVESCQVNLLVETLRISVDVKDDMTAQQCSETCEKIYQLVDSSLPVATYFTRQGEFKQYDLEINVYDNLKKDDPVMLCLVKNGSMEEYHIQVLSEPVNEELAYDLTHPDDGKQDEPVGENTEEDDNTNSEPTDDE